MDGQTAQTVYGALALIPPILAIALAIWKRQVIASLLFGIWIGATIIDHYNPLMGLMDTFSKYIVKNSLADPWNIGVITFCLGIGGMIGVIGKSGGTQAIADSLVKKAKDSKSTLITTAFMGIAIFFDDYANSLIVGNAMRPLTDRQKIPREKLAYILDSTAAPVSSVAPLSTWIAMELGLIAAGLKEVHIHANSMMVFFQTIPYRFYSIFAVVILFTIILERRDFGPMLKAEIRAKKSGQLYAQDSEPMVTEDKDLLPDEGVVGSIWDAILPIGFFILVTIFGLWYNGGGMEAGKSLKDAFGDADASVVLNWAAYSSSILAVVLALSKKTLTLKKSIDSWVSGAKSMFIAVIILALAFALKSVVTDMNLAKWLVGATTGVLSGSVLPTLTFIIALLVAFATGTSWGTNAIIMPIVIPIAANVSQASGNVTSLIVATIGAVLTGAVFGDHCSPISDTTILSSMAAGSDHIDHVRTQIPYAVTAGIVAILIGFIPSGFGVPVWVSLIVGSIILYFTVKFVGKKLDKDGNIIK